jgi:predicted amidophosphoribosyltransferase
MPGIFDLLTSEQLLQLRGLSCPRCAAQLPLRANFCGRCTLRLNDARYFAFLANWPRHLGPLP